MNIIDRVILNKKGIAHLQKLDKYTIVILTAFARYRFYNLDNCWCSTRATEDDKRYKEIVDEFADSEFVEIVNDRDIKCIYAYNTDGTKEFYHY